MSFWESNFHYWFLYKNYLNFWKAFCFLFHVNSAFLFHSLVHFTLYTVVSIFCKKKKIPKQLKFSLICGCQYFYLFFSINSSSGDILSRISFQRKKYFMTVVYAIFFFFHLLFLHSLIYSTRLFCRYGGMLFYKSFSSIMPLYLLSWYMVIFLYSLPGFVHWLFKMQCLLFLFCTFWSVLAVLAVYLLLLLL